MIPFLSSLLLYLEDDQTGTNLSSDINIIMFTLFTGILHRNPHHSCCVFHIFHVMIAVFFLVLGLIYLLRRHWRLVCLASVSIIGVVILLLLYTRYHAILVLGHGLHGHSIHIGNNDDTYMLFIIPLTTLTERRFCGLNGWM
jgi:hypothetical protein